MMKKIVLSLLAITVMAAVVNAQTDKSDWMVGGNMTINTTKGNSEFTLLPAAGYFFANNFVAGAKFNVGFSKKDETKYTSLGIGPFARYYFNIKDSEFKPFVEADWSISNETSKYLGVKDSYTVTNFFIGGGLAYFINSNVALEALAGYNRSKIETLDPTNGFAFRIGFQVHLLGHEVARVRGK